MPKLSAPMLIIHKPKSLFVAGYKTGHCSDSLFGAACGSWRFWTLWGNSLPCSSSVSPGAVLSTGSVCCSICLLLVLPIWWILRTHRFLQLFLQKPMFVTGESVLLGYPPPWAPLGVITLTTPVVVSPCCPLSLQPSSHYSRLSSSLSWKSLSWPELASFSNTMWYSLDIVCFGSLIVRHPHLGDPARGIILSYIYWFPLFFPFSF